MELTEDGSCVPAELQQFPSVCPTVQKQRGLICTEHKPLGRLHKMFDPFFHEFRVIPSAKVFQLVCYSATLFTT
jgi:hypothetical protein